MRTIDADALWKEFCKSEAIEERYGSGVLEIIGNIIDNAPTIDAVPQWIPCEERLPEEEGFYIVYAPTYFGGSSSGKENHNGVMFSRWKSSKWSVEHGYHKRPNCVRAWMPLPEPYREREGEQPERSSE